MASGNEKTTASKRCHHKKQKNNKISRKTLSKNWALEKTLSLSNFGARRQHGGNA
jgi:hypothetical protein